MAKPLLRVLNGESVWPPPIWLMRQAGRYLPEYRAIRAKAGSFLKLATTPELAAEITLQPVRRFGFDAAILFSDILIVPWALGHGLTFRDGEGPVMPPLRTAADLHALDSARLPAAAAPVYETVRRVSQALRSNHQSTTLIGFAGAPFTVACYMVEGGGSKDFAEVRRLAYTNPTLLAGLISLLTEATVTYLAAQIEAGAETVMLFDSWAGILPPSLFRTYVIQPTRQVITALAARLPACKTIAFPRLSGLMLGEYTATTGAACVGLDTSTDPHAACRLIPPSIALQGNLDPLALAAGGSALQSQTSAILDAMTNRLFIFNLGHGVVPETPPEHVARLVELVRAA
jgi:uroporphyrinogen decarboxylase